MKSATGMIISLAQAAVQLADSAGADLALEAELCLHSKDKFSTCDICVRACPFEALTLENADGGSIITLDAEKCVNCGLCLPACPVGAFSMDDGLADLLAYVSQLKERKIVELACAMHPDAEKGPPQSGAVVRTNGCLAAFGPSAYMSLLAVGAAHLVLRLDACQSCPLGKAQNGITGSVSQTCTLLADQSDGGPPITLVETKHEDWPIRPVKNARTPSRNRRDFFRSLTVGEDISPTAQKLVDDTPQADGKRPPRERRLLLTALRYLPEEMLSDAPLETFSTTLLRADDNCTACGLCDRACPTGAMLFTVGDDRDRYQLSFAAGACTDCGVCLNYCEPKALHHDGLPTLSDWSTEEPVILRSGDLFRCQKCGAGYTGDAASELCPVCDFRQQNPFGSRLPTGIKRQRKAHE
jgi:ferredoxin